MKKLALFDLDHTLLPIDSDFEWGQFLVRKGLVDGALFAQRNEVFYAQYKAGTLNIHEFLDFILAPLAAHSRDELDRLHEEFMHTVITPNITQAARDLVSQHQDDGALTCIVTATNTFVTGPIASAFGVPYLIGTIPATENDMPNGRFTGKVKGQPSFREGKIARTLDWLKQLDMSMDSFSASWFYSDSINDQSLLEQVTHPVATNPDDQLRQIAQQKNWRILELFGDRHSTH
ncbi:HAD family hydrolase [Ampullimonas aquatilis]|uniref:histidinol-phosphatase n=1 Tax=Ampullimonas aquatilis TaxID=1341549 RepID=UPI003C7447BC